MFEKFKIRIVQNMINNGIIEKEDAEVYQFAIDALKTYLGILVMTLSIGFLMHTFVESFVFLISFKLLRAEAGGYHASSEIKCFFVSVIMLIFSFALIRETAEVVPFWLFMAFLVTSVFIVCCNAPLPDKNNPMNEKERLYHRRRARFIVITESVISLFLYRCSRKIAFTILMAMVVVSTSLVVWLIIHRVDNIKK